jgi:hypothetical protein
LVLAERWATWDRHPFQEKGSDKASEYAVSLHRRP